MTTQLMDKGRKKSEPLTKEEKKALKEYRKVFETDVACAASMGIDRNVLIRVLFAGSGSPETIAKVRAAISKPESTESNGTENAVV